MRYVVNSETDNHDHRSDGYPVPTPTTVAGTGIVRGGALENSPARAKEILVAIAHVVEQDLINRAYVGDPLTTCGAMLEMGCDGHR